ncbi:MAG: hypothetical protein WD651_14790 [Acidimicrobiia bacterium]
MSSPHLLRPFPARQLGLVEGGDRVMVFGVLGGRYAGPSILAHAPTLRRRCNELPAGVDIVAFVDHAIPDAAIVARIDDMLAVFDGGDALVCFQKTTEAMKEVAGEVVVRGVDRSQLVAVRSPEVIRRSALDRAMTIPPAELWVNPTALVAACGGVIKLFSPIAMVAPPSLG